jgi:nucleoside-diphosphate-sugar epimerase
MVFVTGATGYIGRALVAHLTRSGARVRCLVLPGDPLEPASSDLVEVVHGDVTSPNELAGSQNDTRTVVHAAAVMPPAPAGRIRHVNVDGTRHLIEQVKRWDLQRFIYISAVSATYRVKNAYGASKLVAEELVRESGLPFTILRPTMVYGPGGGLHFQTLVDLTRRLPVLLPVIGPGTQRLAPVALDDVVRAIDLVRNHPAAVGKTYGVAGGTVVTFNELLDHILAAGGRTRIKFHVPVRLCMGLAKVVQRISSDSFFTVDALTGITQDATLDWTELHRDCGYSPVSLSTGLDRASLDGHAEISLRRHNANAPKDRSTL